MTQKVTMQEMIQTAFREMLKGVNTVSVGYVASFNPSNQRAQIQVGIQRVDTDGSVHEPSIINDALVLQFGGSTFSIECEIAVGTEGIVLFSQRNLDGWKQTGGVADNPTARLMDRQDALFIPGVRSLPNVLTDFQNNGVRMRNKDASNYVWLKNDGTIEQVNAKGSQTIAPNGTITTKNEIATQTITANGMVKTDNGAGVITLDQSGTVQANGLTVPPAGGGDASYDGIIRARDFVTISGISMTGHRHGGVTAGGADTEVAKQ